jgi:hypothetical protein
MSLLQGDVLDLVGCLARILEFIPLGVSCDNGKCHQALANVALAAKFPLIEISKSSQYDVGTFHLQVLPSAPEASVAVLD